MDSNSLARRVIDASIRALKSRRNALAPVSKLPCEILTFIFETIVIQGRESCAMVPITHVCRYWRRVALDYPPLWTHITGSNSSLEIASRSKKAPIHVLLNRELDQRLTRLFVHFVLGNVHRIQEIHFDVSVPTLRDLLQLFDKPVPLLEVAKIVSRDSVVKIDVSGPTIWQVPRMRKLSLEAIDIAWDERFVCNLTSLTLRSVPLDVPQLLTTLRMMPKLQSLKISEDAEHDEPLPYISRALSTDSPVHLPNLSNLTFAGLFDNCLSLLTHLVFPSYTTITAGTWMSTHAPPNLVSQLMQRLFHGGQLSLHFTACVAGLKFATPSRVLEMVEVKDLRLYLEPGFNQFRSAASVHIALKETLPVAENDLATALGQMGRLTFLNLVLNDSGEALLRALTGPPTDKPPSDSGSTILLPALLQLTVLVDVAPQVEDRFHVLRHFLCVRRDIGVGIMKVKIVVRRGDSRTLSTAELDQLSDLVDYVEVEEGGTEEAPF